MTEFQPQRRSAPLAMVGSHLVWIRNAQLEMWNLDSRRSTGRLHPSVNATAIAAVNDDIIAVGEDPAGKHPWLTRFSGDHFDHVTPVAGHYFLAADRIVDAGAGELWVSEMRGVLARYRIIGRVERVGALEWRTDQARTFCAAAEPGAALYCEADSIVRLDREGTSTFRVADIDPLFLAGGPRRATAWLATRNELYLLSLQSRRARIEWRKEAEGSIYHLARAGERVALFSVELHAGKWRRVSLVVIDAIGTTLWQRTLPAIACEHGWIAASATHIAWLREDELRVYRAADGAGALLVSRQKNEARTMKFFLTLVFSTPLPSTLMYVRLRESCAWKWIDRDGDRWGDYVSTASVPGFPGASLALYHDEPEPGRFTLNVRFRSDDHEASAHFQGLREFLHATLLPSIGAHAINEGEFLE